MARAFNLTVFDQTISGGSPAPYFYTSQEHAALLGSVESLQVQIICRAITASTVILVEYEITNAPEYDVWYPSGTTKTLSVTSVGSLPAVDFMPIAAANALAAYGRLRVSCDAGVTQVQLVVAGYAKS